MTNNTAIKDDALRRALKASLPEPGAAFDARINSCLASLPRETETGSGRFAFFRSRPLLAAALVLLLLALMAGAAYAATTLFHNVFGKAKDSVNESIEQFNEYYPQAREDMESMSPEEAAQLDNELDYESEKLAWQKFLLDHLGENAVTLGAKLGKLDISEFAVFDDPVGVNITVSRFLYFGAAAPARVQMPDVLDVTVDGLKFEAVKADIDIAPTGNEQYAIYRCWTVCSADALSETSLIAVSNGKDRYCFAYCWEEGSAVLPKDDAELEAWLAEIDAMSAKLAELTCECVGYRSPSLGMDFVLTKLEIVNGNELILEADAKADEYAIGKYYSDYGFWLDKLQMGAGLYISRQLPTDYHFTEDVTEGKLSLKITLPFDMNAVSGEKHTLHLRYMFQDGDPRYGGGEKKYADYYFDLLFH